MIKIAISGITGRMGQALYRAVQKQEYASQLELSYATVLANDKSLGKTVSSVLGGSSNVKIQSELSDDFDVLIDFTSIESTLSHVAFCKQHNKAIVIGTTGFSHKDKQQINEASQLIPIFLSANMSIGVNVVNQLLELASLSLSDQSDIEIIEAHHKHKVDAPSGTALMLGQTIADTLKINLDERSVKSRDGIMGERESGSIGFSTIRGGDVVGEHSVIYYMDGERVEISHKATDRKIFANGALFAAKFLAHQNVGIYNMNDALNFKN